MNDVRPPQPPFDAETAAQKARSAEDAWNTRDPERVALAYTPDTVWRNRAEFLVGRAEIKAFLERKWAREHDYRLIKEVWAFHDNRISARFAYEWHDDSETGFAPTEMRTGNSTQRVSWLGASRASTIFASVRRSESFDGPSGVGRTIIPD